MNSIKGKVIKVDVQSGTSAKGEWKKTTVVVQTPNQYRNTIPVDFFVEVSTNVGDEVEIHLDIEGHEYNGKYYPDLSGKQLTVLSSGGSTPANTPPTEEADVPATGEDSELPF